MATTFLAFACMNLVLVLPLYFGGYSKPPTPGTPSFRAMLLNVNKRLGDADRVKDFIYNANPDIIVLEEISSQWVTDLASLTNSHQYSVIQPREDNFGIAIFSKLPLAESEIVYIGNAGVPSIVTTVSIDKTKLRVIATHPLPPGGREYSQWRNEQLACIPDYIRSSLPVMVLGDLNVTPWNYQFRKLLKRTGMKDSSQGFGVQPSWPNYNPLLRIPIDHCLHSQNIKIIDRKIGSDVSSDHYPVIVDFVIESE